MPMAKKSTNPESARLRMIGSREETIVEVLDEDAVFQARDRVLDLVVDRADLVVERKAAMSAFKARLDGIDAELGAAAASARAGRRKVKVEVQEWLTKSNEVIRVRADTGDIIGRHTATADELQQDMFDGGGKEAASKGPPLAVVPPSGDFGGEQ